MKTMQIKVMNHTGLLGVLIRQTNIIWLGFFTIERALDIFNHRMEQPVPPGMLNTPLHFCVSNIYEIQISLTVRRESTLGEIIQQTSSITF